MSIRFNSQSSLPTGWVDVLLKDICDIFFGQSPPSSTYNDIGEGLPFFQGKAEFGEIYPTIKKYCSAPVKIAPKNSILLSVRAPVGPTNITSLNCCIGRGLAALVPLGGIATEYMLYLMRSIEKKVDTLGTGSTFKAISKDVVENLSFSIPPLEEQKRVLAKIEELFSELDAGVENLKKAKEQLAVYRQSLLKQAFEGKLTEVWRKENANVLESSDALLKRVKQDREKYYKKQLDQWASENRQWEARGKKGEKPIKPQAQKILPPMSKEESESLPKLPTGWTWVRLGELIETPAYGTSKKSDYGVDGTGVLRIPNIVNRKIDSNDLKFTQFDQGEKDKYTLKSGDLLTIRSNGSISLVGQCALISESDTQYAYAGYLIRLRPLCLLDSTYLLHCFSSLMTRSQIEGKAKSTSGVNNINSQELASLIIPLCSLQEQKIISHEISLALSACEEQESALAESLNHVDFLRASILSKAFSGTLVPQREEDEPASKLLDKIKRERTAAPKPKRESKIKAKKMRVMMANLIDVLTTAKDWVQAQEAFSQCGISNDATTDEIEKIYEELKQHVEQEVIEVERRGDDDWLRLTPKE